MNFGAGILLSLLVALTLAYVARWYWIERRRRVPGRTRLPDLGALAIGCVTNFFDTLGIGSFAPTAAIFRLQRRVADEQIPGTLNVGHALPTIVQALIFIAVVSVNVVTLVGMIAAAVLGAWLGSAAMARLSTRAIRLGMGGALLVAAALLLAKNLDWMPGGGAALGLTGVRLALALAVNFLLGALMMLGVGLYAPCLILVSLLGMDPRAAFPIMMGACAFLMPVGGARFVANGRYHLRSALGLALGGIPGVLLAAYVVRELSVVALRWLVLAVVLYTALQMLLAARRDRAPNAAAAVAPETDSPA